MSVLVAQQGSELHLGAADGQALVPLSLWCQARPQAGLLDLVAVLSVLVLANRPLSPAQEAGPALEKTPDFDGRDGNLGIRPVVASAMSIGN
jgi:hypothetical protein